MKRFDKLICITVAALLLALGCVIPTAAISDSPYVSTEDGSIAFRDFPTLPYRVYKGADGRYFTEDILATRAESFTEFYVDTANGSDSNSGRSEVAPVKTLKRALQLAKGVSFCITIINEDAILYEDGLYGTYYMTHSGIIRARHRATLVGGEKSSNFQKVSGYDNVYVSKAYSGTKVRSSLGVSAVVDMDERNRDEMGLFTAYKPVKSLADVSTSAGTFYYDTSSGRMYVNPRYSVDTIRLMSANTYPLRFDLKSASDDVMLYFENLDLIGASFFSGHSASTGSGNIHHEFVAKNCTFQHNLLNNSVSVHEFNGSYMIDCVSGYCLQDGYNYHAYNLSDANRVKALHVEVNCRAEECGYYRLNFKVGDVNNNLSTGHEGINLLRLNFSGHSSYGPLIADVNGCYSINVDCNVSTDYVYSGSADDFHFTQSGTTARRDGRAILINCNATDSRSNSVALRITVKNSLVIGGNLMKDLAKCWVMEDTVVKDACNHAYALKSFGIGCLSTNNVYWCDKCTDTYVVINTDGTRPEHAITEWVKTADATCTVAGEERGTCIYCDHVETRVIKPTGHSFDSNTDVTCNVCGATRTLAAENTVEQTQDKGCGSMLSGGATLGALVVAAAVVLKKKKRKN